VLGSRRAGSSNSPVPRARLFAQRGPTCSVARILRPLGADRNRRSCGCHNASLAGQIRCKVCYLIDEPARRPRDKRYKNYEQPLDGPKDDGARSNASRPIAVSRHALRMSAVSRPRVRRSARHRHRQVQGLRVLRPSARRRLTARAVRRRTPTPGDPICSDMRRPPKGRRRYPR
jgi:hypothetical protein